ncbi:MAG: cell wall hydrolase [Oscillospiraceae bacterium]|nr:cell wall hydrolase [Oscillospiraceae bacterium]
MHNKAAYTKKTATPPSHKRTNVPVRKGKRKQQQKPPRRKIYWHRVLFLIFLMWVIIRLIVFAITGIVGFFSSGEEELFIGTSIYAAEAPSESIVVEPPSIDKPPLPSLEDKKVYVAGDEYIYIGEYANADNYYVISDECDLVEEPCTYEVVPETIPEPQCDLLHFIRMSLTPRQLRLLKQLVMGEAGGEPFRGQVAVAAVFINRYHANSSEFGFGFYGVFNRPWGFSPVRNGQVFLGVTLITDDMVTDSVREAVMAALNGEDPSNGALFFFNPEVTRQQNPRGAWERSGIVDYIMIGRHKFYSDWPDPIISCFYEWLAQGN